MSGINSRSLPRIIKSALFLIQSLNLYQGIKLAQGIMYLWREFYIKTRIEPVILEYKIEFKYKDETLITCKLKDLKDMLTLIEKVKSNRGMKQE